METYVNQPKGNSPLATQKAMLQLITDGQTDRQRDRT